MGDKEDKIILLFQEKRYSYQKMANVLNVSKSTAFRIINQKVTTPQKNTQKQIESLLEKYPNSK